MQEQSQPTNVPTNVETKAEPTLEEKLVAELKQRVLQVAQLKKVILEYEKEHEFKITPGLPTKIVKLGSAQQGWIPSPEHFAQVRRFLKDTKADEKCNILLFNFGIETEITE